MENFVILVIFNVPPAPTKVTIKPQINVEAKPLHNQ